MKAVILVILMAWIENFRLNFISLKFYPAGKFVTIKGTVVRVGNIKPLCTVMAFKCASCSFIQVKCTLQMEHNTSSCFVLSQLVKTFFNENCSYPHSSGQDFHRFLKACKIYYQRFLFKKKVSSLSDNWGYALENVTSVQK